MTGEKLTKIEMSINAAHKKKKELKGRIEKRIELCNDRIAKETTLLTRLEKNLEDL